MECLVFFYAIILPENNSLIEKVPLLLPEVDKP